MNENSESINVPPIKCQGIKTKIVPFIKENIGWDGEGKWLEPFLGSGVVLFNIVPKRAIISDTNCHIIRFYQKIQNKEIDGRLVREYLEDHGKKLLQFGDEYYYKIRDNFNKKSNLLDFLFLNRSCFNGVMRFNSKGGFNVPFCHKLNRFSKSYVTKIVNQVEKINHIIDNKDWTFVCCDWKETLSKAKKGDFVYLDPPYIGRHTDYYGSWSGSDAEELANVAGRLSCPFILSMWSKNKYRTNEHLNKCWGKFEIKTYTHFYHVGSKESLRNEMEEALVLGNFK
jgi:DNA adenine methylase